LVVTTSDPDPLPIRRLYAHSLVGLIVLGVFVEIALFSTGPWTAKDSQAGRLDWMATWGWTLRDATPETLLTYVALALVLYGISLGGQSAFKDTAERARVRRSVGVMGAALAMSAMALCIFAIAGTTAHSKLIPLLVVIVPTTVATWTLGIEVSRFVVSAHGKQLENARAQLTSVEARITALGRHAPIRRGSNRLERLPLPDISIALTSIVLRAAVIGLVVGLTATATTTAPALDGFLPATLISTIFSAGGLIMFAGITSGNLVIKSKRSRWWTSTVATVLYVLLLLLGFVNLLTIVPNAEPATLAFLIFGLLSPVGFRRRWASKQPSAGRWAWSLRGALVAFEGSSLSYNKNQTARRIDELEHLKVDTNRTVWRRLSDGIREALE
jgi:hypothetical protein